MGVTPLEGLSDVRAAAAAAEGTGRLQRFRRSLVTMVETMRLALDSLRAHKLRSFLTLLGVILAVATLVTVMSFVSGMNFYVADRIANLGANVYIVDRFGFAVAPRMLAAWGRGERTEQVVQGVLGVSVDQLDHDFREATRTRLADRATDWYVDLRSYDDPVGLAALHGLLPLRHALAPAAILALQRGFDLARSIQNLRTLFLLIGRVNGDIPFIRVIQE